MKDNLKNQQARAVLKRRIISFPNDGELRVESIIREFEDYAMIDCKRKRIRDATLHTFIYHYIFAAKSKSLII